MRIGRHGLGFGVLLLVTGLVTPVGAGIVSGQSVTGKLQGTVRDSSGTSLPSAQILIVGTAFGAVTDSQGYYFLNNVPPGTYTVRAQLIGYALTEAKGARVLGGQTVDLNITLHPAAVTVSGVSVVAAANPLVPRDQVSTKSIVTGQLVNELPVDDVRQAVALQPGVVETRTGLSLRGSRPGEAQVYIDGAPVRPMRGPVAMNGVSSSNLDAYGDDQRLQLATNAVEEVAVTTGAMGVETGNAQSGVISYTTRTGGARWQGSLAYETDEPFGSTISQGVNRFEGSLGGPVPGVDRLRLFGSAMVQGIGSTNGRTDWGAGWNEVPSYLPGGIDTTVTQDVKDDAGNVIGRRQVVVPQYAQVTGNCPAGSDPANPVHDAILHNYGYDCQGGRLPMAWSTNIQLSGKAFYSYSEGSSVSLTGLANGSQSRDWPGTFIGDPALFVGHHDWSRAAIFNLQHQVFKEPDRELALNANLSWQQENHFTGPLDPNSEVTSRDPALGIELGSLAFQGMVYPFPITESYVDSLRAGTSPLVPYSDRTDLRRSQPYRLNPYGMASGGWFTEGSQPVSASTLRETRYTAHGAADWQVNRFNRLTIGAEGFWRQVAEWRVTDYISTTAAQAYVASPVLWAVFGADRLDLGDVVLEVGLRYDHFNVNSLFPIYPGHIYDAPQWSPMAGSNPDSFAASLDRLMTPSTSHAVFSPRVRVSFPVTERTDIRVSYGQQAQEPDAFLMLRGTNVTSNGYYMGRDVDFSRTILFEFGVRHAFTDDLVLDGSAYNKSMQSELTFRTTGFPDPTTSLGSVYYVPTLTNLDFGYARGVDLKLDWRIGTGFVSSTGYTFLTSKGTASDPFSAPEQVISQVTGDNTPLAQAVRTTGFDRTHNLVGTVAWTTPPDSKASQALGGLIRGVGVYAAFRYLSGFPFTLTDPSGRPLQGVNESRMPPTRQLDLRITKTIALGRSAATFYLDARNLLNYKNVVAVFGTTGGVTDSLDRHNSVSPELDGLKNEARQEGALGRDGTSIDLRQCGTWANQVDCVALTRTEARFGNGDGIYSTEEQTRALNAWYDLVAGAQWHYGPPRRIRIGVELSL